MTNDRPVYISPLVKKILANYWSFVLCMTSYFYPNYACHLSYIGKNTGWQKNFSAQGNIGKDYYIFKCPIPYPDNVSLDPNQISALVLWIITRIQASYSFLISIATLSLRYFFCKNLSHQSNKMTVSLRTLISIFQRLQILFSYLYTVKNLAALQIIKFICKFISQFACLLTIQTQRRMEQ